MELGLAGQRLARVLVDFDIYLEFDSGDTVAFSEFAIHTSSDVGAEVDVDYESLARGLSALLPLIGEWCSAAWCSDDGELTVTFARGDRIVAPHGDGEAWEFSGADGRRVISGPGGELSIWSAQ